MLLFEFCGIDTYFPGQIQILDYIQFSKENVQYLWNKRHGGHPYKLYNEWKREQPKQMFPLQKMEILLWFLYWQRSPDPDHLLTFVFLKFTSSLRKHAYSNILKKLQPKKKKENFQIENSDIFNVCARRGDSNEYPQSMFFLQNKKNNYTLEKPSFTIKKSGVEGGQNYIGVYSWCAENVINPCPAEPGYILSLQTV